MRVVHQLGIGRAAAISALLWVTTAAAAAGRWDSTDTVVVRDDAELRAVIGERIPVGATLLLAPGQYAGGLAISNLRGEEGKPITIAAQDPKRPPVISGRAVGFHLSNPSHVELRDL